MRYLAPALAILILIGSGIVNGTRTDRWSRSSELAARTEALDRVPMEIGGWTGRRSALDPRVMEFGNIAGSVVGHFADASGQLVTVLIACGRPGPISVHTPDICYPSTGYRQVAENRRRVVDTGREDSLWVADYSKDDEPPTDRIRIYHAWNADGTWIASDRPRMDFGNYQALYKLYIIRPLGPDGMEDPFEDDLEGFLQALLPNLRECLFPAGRDRDA